MPMFKIYVGNLDPRVKIEQVRELFSPFVTIEDAVLVNDPANSKPKGFAIIMVRDPEIGRAAVKATQGKRLLGKTLTINEVMKKGQAAAKVAKETRQGPFGPHFNRQGGGRAGTVRGGGGSVRRGINRGPRGSALGGTSGAGYGPMGGATGSGPAVGPLGGSTGSSLGPRPSGLGGAPSRPPEGDGQVSSPRPPLGSPNAIARTRDSGATEPGATGSGGGSSPTR